MQGNVFGDQAYAGLAQAKADCRERDTIVSPRAAGGLIVPELESTGTAPTSYTAQQAAAQTAPLNAWRSPLPACGAAVGEGSDPTVCEALSTHSAPLDDSPCGLVAEATADSVQPAAEPAWSQPPRGLSADSEAAAAAETACDWDTLHMKAETLLALNMKAEALLSEALPSPSVPPTGIPILLDPDAVSVTWRIL